MTKIETALNRVNGLVATAIKSSKEHFKHLQSASVASFVFAAEHGQCGPLNKLFSEVSTGDKTAIRMFVVNVKKEHEKAYKNDKGESKMAFFLAFSKDKGFSLAEQTEFNSIAIKETKKTILDLGEKGLSNNGKYTFGDKDSAGRLSADFNVNQFLERAIMTLARNGESGMAKQINRIAGNITTDGKIEQTAADNDVMAKITKAKENLAELEAKAEKQNARKAIANGNENENEKAQVAA